MVENFALQEDVMVEYVKFARPVIQIEKMHLRLKNRKKSDKCV